MSKKKIITIVSIILAIVLLAGGGYLVYQNMNNQNPKPTPGNSSGPQTLEEEQKELEAMLEEFQNTDEYKETVANYSQYLNIEESVPGDIYNGNLTIPSVYAVSKYIEEGYFNPYFVSDYWQTKDDYSANSINSFLGDYITNSYKEALVAGIPANINNRIFVPDTAFGIPVGCAEDWTDYECFNLPPEIKKITYKGLNAYTAVYTAEFQMNVNVQDANKPVGEYTVQQRYYKVDFTVTNTKSSIKDLKFTDIKINEVSPTVEITNISPASE